MTQWVVKVVFRGGGSVWYLTSEEQSLADMAFWQNQFDLPAHQRGLGCSTMKAADGSPIVVYDAREVVALERNQYVEESEQLKIQRQMLSNLKRMADDGNEWKGDSE